MNDKTCKKIIKSSLFVIIGKRKLYFCKIDCVTCKKEKKLKKIFQKRVDKCERGVYNGYMK